MFNHADNSLVAYMLRADCLKRWPLMYGSEENVAVHTYSVAIIAHRLALYAKEMGHPVDPNEVAVLALFHEAAEMGGVGDISGPIKRATPEMYAAVKEIEGRVERSMVSSVASDYAKAVYKPLVIQDYALSYNKRLVKCADELQMYIKCTREVNGGNGEFVVALEKQTALIEELKEEFEEVRFFVGIELESCLSTLDQLQK